MDELIEAGTVVEVDATKSLVKVDLLGVITTWLPMLQQANSFKRQFVSLRIGQQVVVLANRYVIGAIFNVDCKEPNGSNEHIDICVYEDGTRIEYNSKSKQLTINAVGEVSVNASKVNVSAKQINVTGGAGDVVVNGISLINHTHPQNSGNHFGGGANTSKPQ